MKIPLLKVATVSAVAIAVAIFLQNLPRVQAAGSFTDFGSEKPVSLEDFRPHLMDEEMYSEQWNAELWLDDGGRINSNFFISNLGIGDHKGAVQTELVDPKGKRIATCKSEYSEGEWSSDPSGFHLTFGDNELLGDFKELQVRVSCQEFSYTLVFTNQAAPYQPGSGKLVFEVNEETKGVYHIVFLSPRATVTGTLNQNGQKQPVRGIGLCSHSYSNLGPQTLARRWLRFKILGEAVSIILVEVENPPEAGSTKRGYVMVYGPEGRILASARVRFAYDGWIQDTKAEEGYRIPRRVRFVAADGSTSMTGTMVMNKIKEVNDPLADLDFFRRAIARNFSKPRDYVLSCNYSFKIKNAQGERSLDGEDIYRFVFVNP